MSLSILRFCSAFFCLMVASCHADAVLTANATCSATNLDLSTTTISSSTGRCGFLIGPLQANASTTTSFTFAPGKNTVSASLMLSASAFANFQAPPPGCIFNTSCGRVNVVANAEYDVNLVTNGPLRNGVLLLTYSEQYGSAETHARAFFSLNGSNVPCIGFQCDIFNRAIAIPLGQALTFSLLGNVDSFANPAVGGTGGSASSGVFTASVFESDGVTPVALLDPAAVPEPASWALCGLPLAFFLFRRSRKNACEVI